MSGSAPLARGRSAALRGAAAVLVLGGLVAIVTLPRTGRGPHASRVEEGGVAQEPPQLAPGASHGRPARDAVAREGAGDPLGARPEGEGRSIVAGAPSAERISTTFRFVDALRGTPLRLRSAEGRGVRGGEPAIPQDITLLEADSMACVRWTSRKDWKSFEDGPPGFRFPLEVLYVVLPEGWMLPDGFEFTGPISADARRLLVLVPSWREIPLEVDVVDEQGRPFDEALISRVLLGGQETHIEIDELGGGRRRIRGLPLRPGELVQVFFESKGVEVVTPVPPEPQEWSESLPQEPGEARTRVPEDDRAPWAVRAVLSDRKVYPGTILERNGVDFDFTPEASLGEGAADDGRGPRGSVSVRVVGFDGLPIQGAEVAIASSPALGPTNAQGTASVSGVRPGEHRLLFGAPGRLLAEALVTVVADTEASVVLREPQGATLDVLVLDAAGEPRPFAELSLPGARVFDVHDGEQRIDPYTDEHGRRTLARVQPGPLTVVATWGRHRGATKIEAREGERLTVRVVAK